MDTVATNKERPAIAHTCVCVCVCVFGCVTLFPTNLQTRPNPPTRQLHQYQSAPPDPRCVVRPAGQMATLSFRRVLIRLHSAQPRRLN